MLAPTANRFVPFFKGFTSPALLARDVGHLDPELLSPHLKRDLGIVDFDAIREPRSRIFDLIRLGPDSF